MRIPELTITRALMLCFVAIAVGITIAVSQHSYAALPEVIGKAPPFTLTTVNNTPLSSDELKGKVWLMNFFFASCPGPCPLINAELKKLREISALQNDLRILSVTVDPARDTPERLATYAAHYEAKPGSWDFLTGDEAKIRSLIEEGFKLISADDVSMHTTRIVLVDRNGDIRGFYQGTEPDGIKQMFQDAEVVVRGSQ